MQGTRKLILSSLIILCATGLTMFALDRGVDPGVLIPAYFAVIGADALAFKIYNNKEHEAKEGAK